jgi:hypothetical protein
LAGVVWGFILAPGSLPCPLRAGPGTAPGRDSQSGLGLGVNSLLTPSLLASTNLFFPGGLQSVSLGARTLWIYTHPSLSLFPLHSSLTPNVPGVLLFSMPPLHPEPPETLPAGAALDSSLGAASLRPFLSYLLRLPAERSPDSIRDPRRRIDSPKPPCQSGCGNITLPCSFWRRKKVKFLVLF